MQLKGMVIKMKDKYGRNIEYLRISLTDRCNLRCKYCMPEEEYMIKTHGEIMTLEEIYEVVEICTELGVKKIRLTGGEPLTRLGVTSSRKISKLDKVTDISMTTNAVLLKKYAKRVEGGRS